MATKQEIAAKLADIPDDEPLFLLRGRDVIAPITVRLWCENARTLGVDDVKVDKASAVVARMFDYRPRCLPD